MNMWKGTVNHQKNCVILVPKKSTLLIKIVVAFTAKKSTSKCKFCNCNEHNTFQNACPEMKKQFEIKKDMIINNSTFMEAKRLVESTTEVS